MTQPRRLPLETWGRHWLGRLQAWADRRAWSRYGFEFLMFGIKQAWACLFGGAMLALFALTAVLFGRGWFYFTPDRKRRSMPFLPGFFLVATFIWLAENIATFANAWVYPSQSDGWHMVSIDKLGSWFLLMMISVVLVSLVHRPEEEPEEEPGRER